MAIRATIAREVRWWSIEWRIEAKGATRAQTPPYVRSRYGQGRESGPPPNTVAQKAERRSSNAPSGPFLPAPRTNS